MSGTAEEITSGNHEQYKIDSVVFYISTFESRSHFVSSVWHKSHDPHDNRVVFKAFIPQWDHNLSSLKDEWWHWRETCQLQFVNFTCWLTWTTERWAVSHQMMLFYHSYNSTGPDLISVSDKVNILWKKQRTTEKLVKQTLLKGLNELNF